MAKEKDKMVFEIELTEEQMRSILSKTGIDLKPLKRLRLTAKELIKLINLHDPDKHDQTVGASQLKT